MRFSCLYLALVINYVCSKLEIQVDAVSPSALVSYYKNTKMDLTLANFGYVPYGKSLIGNVHLADPSDGCKPLNYDSQNLGESSPIFLIQRGGCPFVTKASYAQTAGAKLVLIMDNKIENESSVIMVDNGHGNDINIPTLMISEFDALELLKFANSTNPADRDSITLQFFFPIVHTNNKVNYEIWISSSDSQSYNFIKEFKQHHELLQDSVSFKPHYAIWYCSYCSKNDYKTVIDECVSGGRYCAPDPDSSGTLIGRDVVMEDLRQICIFEIDPKYWWQYMTEFKNECIDKNTPNYKYCGDSIIKKSAIQLIEIDNCILKSFNYNTDYKLADNQYLKSERNSFLGEGIQIWPSILINNQTLRGNLQDTNVFNALCSSFDSPPQICQKNSQVSITETESGPSVFLIVILISFIMLVFFFFYKRSIKKEMAKEMQLQVNTAISQYFALNDSRSGK